MRLFFPRAEQPDHASQPHYIMLEVAGAPVRIALRRNKRARRYTLRLPTAGGDPVLTIPERGSLEAARDFAERHREWLAAHMALRPVAKPFVAGSMVPLRGIAHRIEHAAGLRGPVRLVTGGETPSLVVTGETPHLARRLTDYLKREARGDLTEAVARHAQTLKRRPSALTIRDTRSRWGSCTSVGRLSFSWRLVLAPPFVLDYVAAHEMAHLIEMNHSERFWTLTRDLFPQTEKARAWLKHHGALLHSYG